jgi:hypothetical protein
MLRVQNGDLRLGRKGKASVPEVAGYSNDSNVRRVRYIRTGGDLQEWRRSNVNLPADGILPWEKAPLELLADECHRRTRGAVRFGEVSALNEGNSQSLKEMSIR